MDELTLEKFEEASEIVKQVTLETKLVYSEYFSAQTGNRVYFKPENMQYTGAYKVRGAYYKISTLSEEEKSRGLITASAGNHAQGVAYAARLAGVKATVVMPTTTPLIKVNRTKGYGADVVLEGDVFDEACAHAYKPGRGARIHLVHPFDDLDVAAGLGFYCHGDYQRASYQLIISWFLSEAAACAQEYLPCQDVKSKDQSNRR